MGFFAGNSVAPLKIATPHPCDVAINFSPNRVRFFLSFPAIELDRGRDISILWQRDEERERERESCLRDFIDRGCESPRHRSLGLSPCRRERVHEERRTVAVEPRVSLACNRIAMLILSRPRGYVERERPACLVRIRDESEFQFQLRGRRRRAEPRLARCPFPALIPFIAN